MSDDIPDDAVSAAVPDDTLDARGLLCPLPVLKTRKRLLSLPVGGVLEVTATDPAARVDVPHFCGEQGHALLSVRDTTGADGAPELVFLLRRGG
ncbi:MAG: sulfurtransferase TusA family protein [Pseudomonadota bacterium]